MLTNIICSKCGGCGYIAHHEENRVWSEKCDMCNGVGNLGKIDIDEIDMVTITRQKYEELLEYKRMYERLCY